MSKRKKLTLEAQSCPCGSSKVYAACCQPWHQGEHYLQAPDALALMRSRYTAYVFQLNTYLLDTWHPITRPTTLDETESSIQWLDLQIHNHQEQSESSASVEFTAKYRLNGKAHVMHENSRFEKEGAQWYYIDGVVS